VSFVVVSHSEVFVFGKCLSVREINLTKVGELVLHLAEFYASRILRT
jgi:hypothetical protein